MHPAIADCLSIFNHYLFSFVVLQGFFVTDFLTFAVYKHSYIRQQDKDNLSFHDTESINTYPSFVPV